MPFSEGHIPYNKGTKVTVDRNCEFCGNKFTIAKSQLNRELHKSGKFCSKKCFYNFRKKFGKRAQIQKLYEEGKTYREIGIELNILPSTVAGLVYRMKIMNRFGDGIYSNVYKYKIKNLLKDKYDIKSCELCGFDRVFEIAHILERKNGGKYILNNCVLLCPNCHHLFDHKLLDENEIKKLKQITRLNGNLERRLNYVT